MFDQKLKIILNQCLSVDIVFFVFLLNHRKTNCLINTNQSPLNFFKHFKINIIICSFIHTIKYRLFFSFATKHSFDSVKNKSPTISQYGITSLQL